MSYVYVKVETHARPAARSKRAAAAVATLGTHWTLVSEGYFQHRSRQQLMIRDDGK